MSRHLRRDCPLRALTADELALVDDWAGGKKPAPPGFSMCGACGKVGISETLAKAGG